MSHMERTMFETWILLLHENEKKNSLNWRNTVKITNFNTYPTNSTQKRDDSWKYSKICFVVDISVALSCFLSLSLEIPLSTHANLIWSYVLMGFRYIACNQHNIIFFRWRLTFSWVFVFTIYAISMFSFYAKIHSICCVFFFFSRLQSIVIKIHFMF